MSMIESIAKAIARQEGYYNANWQPQSNTLAYRNNNPGNLRSWGSNPVVSGYAQFPTVDQGWQALYRQVQLNIDRGLTLEEFFAGKPGVYGGYAPAADSNLPYTYANNVASWTGIPLGIPLNQLLDPATGTAPDTMPTEVPTTGGVATTDTGMVVDTTGGPSASGPSASTGIAWQDLGLPANIDLTSIEATFAQMSTAERVLIAVGAAVALGLIVSGGR